MKHPILNTTICSRNNGIQSFKTAAFIHIYSVTLLLSALFLSTHAYGQAEFVTYKNGLIYSEKTISKLAHIVDSLNLKYSVCDLNKSFNSKLQTIGHTIKLDTNNVEQAKKDIENNISFKDFILKYPNAVVNSNVLVVKYKYKNYKEKDVVEFSKVDLNGDDSFQISKDDIGNLYQQPLINSWVFSYHKKTKYSKESINAFYFTEDFTAASLPLKYAKQIGYSDCLIDTTTTKFKDNLKTGWISLPKNWEDLPDKNKRDLLEEMRATKVIGGCSMDSRPRSHAVNIAMLSAETTNWEVFLKSHLDIMNDRFDRVSDGSYAYAKRQTYIKELEELNINVVDLLIGISLRVENPANNHYYGSIGRLGRAISESKSKEKFKLQILSMIEDENLDHYNRVLAYFLFASYNNYLANKKEQNANTKLLARSIKTLPTYLKENIKLDEK